MSGSRETLHTSELLRRLFRTTSFERFLSEEGEAVALPPFHEYLRKLCEERGEVREHVIQRADIERTYGHQIFRGIRSPSRDKVIQLAFGFRMTPEEAQRLLTAARKPQLYPRLRRDAAILYGLSHRLDVTEMQELLERQGVTILGGVGGD